MSPASVDQEKNTNIAVEFYKIKNNETKKAVITLIININFLLDFNILSRWF